MKVIIATLLQFRAVDIDGVIVATDEDAEALAESLKAADNSGELNVVVIEASDYDSVLDDIQHM